MPPTQDAAEWTSGAVEVAPALRRLRDESEIDRLRADAAAGDAEAGAFLALWPSILRTARNISPESLT